MSAAGQKKSDISVHASVHATSPLILQTAENRTKCPALPEVALIEKNIPQCLMTCERHRRFVLIKTSQPWNTVLLMRYMAMKIDI